MFLLLLLRRMHAGVGGPDCSQKDSRPCTNQYSRDKNSSTRASHIGGCCWCMGPWKVANGRSADLS